MGRSGTSPDRESALSHCALGPCQSSAKASGVCQGKPRIGIVVGAPPFGEGAGHAAAIEQGHVQQLIVQPTIEAFDKGILHRLAPVQCSASPLVQSDQAGIAVESVQCRYLRRSSWVGDHDDVIKLPCHPNAGDRRERLKALSGAGEISVVFERLAQRYCVIAFDRLGFGHTNQARSRTWTPTVQGAHSARYPASDRGRH